MAGFVDLLRRNHNYRRMWMGQVVSEVGDHFNNIAVFSLAMHLTGSGLVVTGVMLSRAVSVILAGPVAGVVLDRFDRKRIMIASDIARAAVALCFILTIGRSDRWLLYLLSGLLMSASPFFTSGRGAILPVIASREELHTANALTQTTQWTTLTLGTFLGGLSTAWLGFEWAFVFNASSFLFSALCVSRLRAAETGFRAERRDLSEDRVVRPWREYMEGLRYMRSFPLVLGIAMIHVGWATGGGAAQILFPLFGEQVFGLGPAGTGILWGFAGVGLLTGGAVGHWLGRRLSFEGYKRTIAISYVIHGGAYVLFSQMPTFGGALFFMALSRAGVAVSSVLNFSQLLRHVSNDFRGRVFSTLETLTWATMMLSMTGAGLASGRFDPRQIGAASGILSSMTALFWAWADLTGRLPEPAPEGVEPEEIEIHGDPQT
jgi:MFS family permease